MRTHDHDVGPYMELIAVRVSLGARLVRYPCTGVHVRNPDPIDTGIASGQAVLDPLQEDRVEASWFVMVISGDARKAGPFVRSFAKYTVFVSRRGRPIEYGRVLGNEGRPSPQRIRDLVFVVGGMTSRRYLSKSGD